MKLPIRFLPLLPALCLAACSGTSDEPTSTIVPSADPVAGGRIKTGDGGDDDFHKMASKYGDMNPNMVQDPKAKNGGKKEFAGFQRDNPEFKGRWDKKEYKGGEKKKSFWGDKDYVTKVYDGKTDANSLKKDSRFGNQKANEGSVAAHDSDKTYRTDAYATSRAREEGTDGLPRFSDAETDERRRVFTSPDIIPWKQQNGISVDDTNRMMGR